MNFLITLVMCLMEILFWFSHFYESLVVKAVQKALYLLRTGGLIDDAKRLFSRDLLCHLLKIEVSTRSVLG